MLHNERDYKEIVFYLKRLTLIKSVQQYVEYCVFSASTITDNTKSLNVSCIHVVSFVLSDVTSTMKETLGKENRAVKRRSY